MWNSHTESHPNKCPVLEFWVESYLCNKIIWSNCNSNCPFTEVLDAVLIAYFYCSVFICSWHCKIYHDRLNSHILPLKKIAILADKNLLKLDHFKSLPAKSTALTTDILFS